MEYSTSVNHREKMVGSCHADIWEGTAEFLNYHSKLSYTTRQLFLFNNTVDPVSMA